MSAQNTIEIGYSVGRESFSMTLAPSGFDTPRSIHSDCLRDYQQRTGNTVTLPYHDDDNDVHRRSNIRLIVRATRAIRELPQIREYWATVRELQAEFNN